MINQTAKKILKALSFDGVEVEAFRHMADLKRLDPMKIFYKKIDEKIYNGSHAVPIRIFFPTEKSFRESEEKKHNIQDKKNRSRFPIAPRKGNRQYPEHRLIWCRAC